MNTLTVYIGDFGCHKIPDEVLATAVVMNAGKPITDRRTRGAKLIEFYGKSCDATEAAALGIAQNLTPDGEIIKRA
jgi:hypothetical protein